MERNQVRQRDRQEHRHGWRLAAVCAVTVWVAATSPAAAENLLDALFSIFSPATAPPPPLPTAPVNSYVEDHPTLLPRSHAGGHGPAYCVRLCDGKYFPIDARGGMSPAQLCNAFCPASATRVFIGRSIESAIGGTGERYSQLENAYAYRTALSANCTCNGRDPAGLAPIDLTVDTTLRPGDIVSTSNGLIAYTGAGSNTTDADFTPVEDYAGLSPDFRARLRDLKVAPVSADVMSDEMPLADLRLETFPLTAPLPATPLRPRDQRAGLN